MGTAPASVEAKHAEQQAQGSLQGNASSPIAAEESEGSHEELNPPDSSKSPSLTQEESVQLIEKVTIAGWTKQVSQADAERMLVKFGFAPLKCQRITVLLETDCTTGSSPRFTLTYHDGLLDGITASLRIPGRDRFDQLIAELRDSTGATDEGEQSDDNETVDALNQGSMISVTGKPVPVSSIILHYYKGSGDNVSVSYIYNPNMQEKIAEAALALSEKENGR